MVRQNPVLDCLGKQRDGTEGRGGIGGGRGSAAWLQAIGDAADFRPQASVGFLPFWVQTGAVCVTLFLMGKTKVARIIENHTGQVLLRGPGSEKKNTDFVGQINASIARQ